ncbi:MAG: divergent polysaccharide deacetylase family protein [Pseudomonadota bacterium]
MSRNLKAKQPRPKRSRTLLASWSIFVAVIVAFFGWTVFAPTYPDLRMSNALVLDLPEATPLEEFVFANAEELEDNVLDGGSETIWDLVTSNLVEETEMGLLPAIADDGLQPRQAYAEKADVNPKNPRIAIIVTNLGPDHILTSQAIERLPSPVTLAFSPYTAAINQSIKQARDHHHEVLLGIALESQRSPTSNLSPHTLLTYLSPEENTQRLHWILSQTGGYVGLVGLSGSQFLNNQTALEPFFRQLKDRGLLFVDSQAVATANNLAQDMQLPHLACSHVLKQTPDSTPLERQLHNLERDARRKGQAIAIVQANTSSLEVLSHWTPTLEQKGLTLIPITALLPAPEVAIIMTKRDTQE